MSGSKFGRRSRLAALSAILALTLVAPMAVSADTSPPARIDPAASRGATISVDSAIPVTARLIANVTIRFTCDPLQVFDWSTGQTVETTVGRVENGRVVVLQVAGRTINSGSTDFYGGPDAVCDGATVNARVFGVAASVVPWKTGTAIAGASVILVSNDYQSSDYGSTGPVTVKLGR